MNVDRNHRDQLVDAIECYLADKIKTDKFEDKIDKISDASDDPTVAHVVSLLWYYYDDMRNHKVTLSKEEWDYFYRLILLLKSNAHIEVKKRKLWCFTQIFAAVALALFAIFVVWFGIGIYLFAFSIPFFVLSILLSHFRYRSIPQLTPMQGALTPFLSISEILTIRCSICGFRKRQYPQHMKSRIILHSLINLFYLIPSYIVGFVFSPVFLVPQLFPETLIQARVRVSP